MVSIWQGDFDGFIKLNALPPRTLAKRKKETVASA